MNFKKSNILKIAFSIILALLFTLYVYTCNASITPLFFMESFVLLAFFNIIIISAVDRFNPFSFFLLSLFLGVLDIIFVVIDVRIIDVKHSMHIYEKSLFLIIIWLICFLIGYFFKIKNNNPKRIKLFSLIDSFFEKSNVNIMLWLGLIISGGIAFIIIRTIIALGSINVAMNNFAVFRYNNQGYLTTLMPLLSISSIAFLERKNKKLAIISMILNFLLISLTGRRGIAINTVIIPFLVYYNYRVKKISNYHIFILLIPLMAFILFIGSLRNQQVTLQEENSGLVNIVAGITNTIEFGENVPDLLYSMEKGRVEFQGLKHSLSGVLGLIPRSIWPNKLEPDHSLITSRLVYYKDITYGKPVGAFGFSYLCFGYIGVILSGLFTGRVTQYLYNWVNNNKNMMNILIYSLTVQSFLSITNPDSQLKIITISIILVILVILSNVKQRGTK